MILMAVMEVFEVLITSAANDSEHSRSLAAWTLVRELALLLLAAPPSASGKTMISIFACLQINWFLVEIDLDSEYMKPPLFFESH